ncbi:phosphatidate cytidylyltransferase [Niastella koreensis]|uniref:Phosphatidate cytidylyltransferase n=2 Tax=Niastella koreensis TaxID=354356 RepID=G8TJB3_NIAKG|nr:phosphatidate cytidylyltransferase [Niastella koreensis]AEV98646.1 phosphatidate cytidylyltransferase [Niastella koreensis GR20-10]OQP44412.1 phosphatidate cytidylyltransferase [Niastella koreensis]
MNNLTQRSITGFILVATIITAVKVSVYSFILLTLIINILALMEFYRLFHVGRKLSGALLSLCIVITLTIVINGLCDWKILLINIPVVFSIFVIELYLKAEVPFYHLAFLFLGILCVTIPLCFFICIACWPISSRVYNHEIILGYFFLLWAGDSGAYFIGKLFGRHHLFERISPKKTWEGSLGGMVCAITVAYVNSHLFTKIDITGWVVIAFIIIVIGTYGDLIKSLMKRTLNLKDSGTILPGHGGMLDRFDSLLGSAPFIFSYLVLFRL